jgi:hypothetical protein
VPGDNLRGGAASGSAGGEAGTDSLKRKRVKDGWRTLAGVGGEYGLSVRETQECARKVGVHRAKGATQLRPAEVEKLRPALAKAQSAKAALDALRTENTRAELESLAPEPPPRVVTDDECDCCHLRLDSHSEMEEGVPLCGHCRDHHYQPGESRNRELARLRDHDKRMRSAFLRARSAADEYRKALRGVAENRDDWREAAVRLVIDHTEGPDRRCTKCDQQFPCELVGILSAVNRGFARKVESLAGFSDKELDRHLHPSRVYDRDYFASVDDDDEETG